MSDPLTTAKEALRDTLADSAVFRELVGADTYDQAKAHVHCNALPKPAGDARAYTKEELTALRPYAIVFTQKEGLSVTIDASNGWSDSGRLAVQIERTLSAAGDWGDLEWEEWVGRLVADLADMAGGTSPRAHLAINRISLSDIGRCPEAEVAASGETQGCTLSIEWGAQGAGGGA